MDSAQKLLFLSAVAFFAEANPDMEDKLWDLWTKVLRGQELTLKEISLTCRVLFRYAVMNGEPCMQTIDDIIEGLGFTEKFKEYIKDWNSYAKQN